MLDLAIPFLTRLSGDCYDDRFVLAVLSGIGLPTQYLSLGQRTLVWGPTGDIQTYAAVDGAFDTQRETMDSEPPLNRITFSNLDRSWYKRINRDGEDYNGALLTLREVFSTINPSVPAVSLLSRIDNGPYMMSGGRMGDNGVTFNFGVGINVLKVQFPAMLSRARRCGLVYKGEDCGSTSSLPTCGKTPQDCAQRHDTILRFVQWPFSNQRFF